MTRLELATTRPPVVCMMFNDFMYLLCFLVVLVYKPYKRSFVHTERIENPPLPILQFWDIFASIVFFAYLCTRTFNGKVSVRDYDFFSYTPHPLASYPVSACEGVFVYRSLSWRDTSIEEKSVSPTRQRTLNRVCQHKGQRTADRERTKWHIPAQAESNLLKDAKPHMML